MEYTTLSHSQAVQLLQYLPAEIAKKIESEDACVIGALDGTDVVGLGIFSYDEFTEDYVECLYLYTIPENRGKGIASGLLFHSEDLFKTQGIRFLSFNLADVPEKIDEWSRFLSKVGYQVIDMNWHILEYDFSVIENCEAIQDCKESSFSFQSLDSRQISYMLHEDKSIPYMIREIIRNESDWQKSLFYTIQGHLAAGVMIRDDGNNELSVHALYLSSLLKNRGILLAMLAQAVQMMKSTHSKDTKMYFYVEYQKQIEAYQALFGQTKADYRICRLEKKLI